MRTSRLLILCGAMALVPACSSAGEPDSVESQAQALSAPASITMTPALLSDAGKPIAAPLSSPHVVPAVPAADPAAGKAARAKLGQQSERAALRTIAMNVASLAGVTSPAKIEAVAAADHQAAASALSGAIINDHAPVHVIKVAGGPFTATHHPPGVAAPQGRFLTVTVDAATHRVTDVGYVDAEPDLTQIDPSIVDLTAP